MPCPRPCPLGILLAALLSVSTATAQDGTLDPTFDGDGRQTVAWDRPVLLSDGVHAIVTQWDSKVVLAGFANAGAPDCLAATARLAGDGSLDATWLPDGRVTFSFGDAPSSAITAAAWQPDDGKLVVAGGAVILGIQHLGLARRLADGSPDPGFGAPATPGSVIQPLAGGVLMAATALVVQDDGKIVVGGYGEQDGFIDHDFFVARFESNGDIDMGFGNDGVWWIPFDQGGQLDDRLAALALQPDGKIVAVGSYDISATDVDTGFVRLLPTGLFDTTFDGPTGNGNGSVLWQLTDSPGDRIDAPHALALQPDGRILFCGDTSVGGVHKAYLGRLLTDGNNDPQLDLRIPNLIVGDADELCEAILVQSDGKLLIAGQSPSSWFAARSDADATLLDPTFGTGGVSEFGALGGDPLAFAAAALSGGRLVLAGTVNVASSNFDFFVARLRNALIFRDGFESQSTLEWSRASSG